RLVAAGARADLDHDALLVARVARLEQLAQRALELVAARAQLWQLALRELADLRVVVARELLALRELGADSLPVAVGRDQLAQRRELLSQLAELGRIAGERGLTQAIFELLVARLDFSDPLEHGDSGRDRLVATTRTRRGEGR